LPVLAGVSRKTFLGTLLADAEGAPRPPRERDDASAALTTVLAMHRIWGVRVHTVRANRDAVAVVTRLLSATD
jgi:dihydropteroate synthase